MNKFKAESHMTRKQMIQRRRYDTVRAVCGDGRRFKIVGFYEMDGAMFKSFLGARTQFYYLLLQTEGPPIALDLPEGQSGHALPVGRGLLKKYFIEMFDCIENPEEAVH